MKAQRDFEVLQHAVERVPISRVPITAKSRLPSSLSQFEEAVGHWRGGCCGDGEPLVDCF